MPIIPECPRCGTAINRSALLYYCPKCHSFVGGKGPQKEFLSEYTSSVSNPKMSVSRDGSMIVVPESDRSTALMRDCQIIWQNVGEPAADIAISQDGNIIVIAGNKSLYAMDRTGRLLWKNGLDVTIETVIVSGNGEIISVYASNETIHVFDKNGNTISKKPLVAGDAYYPDRKVDLMMMSDDGTRLVFETRGHCIHDMFNNFDGGIIPDIVRNVNTSCMGFSRNGNILAYGINMELVVMRLAPVTKPGKPAVLFKYPLGGIVQCVVVSGNGSFIAVGTGGEDNSIYLFAVNGTKLQQLRTTSEIERINIDDDGNYIIARGVFNSVYIYELRRRLFWDLTLKSRPFYIAISGDGRLATASTENKRLLTIDTGAMFQQIENANEEFLQAIRLEHSGDRISAANMYSRLGLSDEAYRCLGVQMAKPPPLADLPVTDPSAINPVQDPTLERLPSTCIACGSRLERHDSLLFCPKCNRFPVEQAPVWKQVWRYDFEVRVTAMVASPDMSYIAVGTEDGSLSIVDFQGKISWREDGGSGFITISPNGNLILTGFDGTLRLYNRHGYLFWEKFTDLDVDSGHFSADAFYIIVASQKKIFVLDLTGKYIRNFFHDQMHKVFFKPDATMLIINQGDRVASGNFRGIDLLDKTLWDFGMKPYCDGNTSLMSKNGNCIVIGGKNKNLVTLGWNGKAIWQKKVGGEIASVDMDKAGSNIIAGSVDGLINAFDGSGKPKWKFNAGVAISDVAISDSGNIIAVTTFNNRLLFLNRYGELLYQQDVENPRCRIIVKDDGLVLYLIAEDCIICCLKPERPVKEASDANIALISARDHEMHNKFNEAVDTYRKLGLHRDLGRVLRAFAAELLAQGKHEESAKMLIEAGVVSPETISSQASSDVESKYEYPLDSRLETRWKNAEKDLRQKIPIILEARERNYCEWNNKPGLGEKSASDKQTVELAQIKLLMDDIVGAKKLYSEAVDFNLHISQNRFHGVDDFQLYLAKGLDQAAMSANKTQEKMVLTIADYLDKKQMKDGLDFIIASEGIAGNSQRFGIFEDVVLELAESLGVQIGTFKKWSQSTDTIRAIYCEHALAIYYVVSGILKSNVINARQGFAYWSSLKRFYWFADSHFPEDLLDEQMTALYDIAFKKGFRFQLTTPFIPRSVLKNGY